MHLCLHASTRILRYVHTYDIKVVLISYWDLVKPVSSNFHAMLISMYVHTVHTLLYG